MNISKILCLNILLWLSKTIHNFTEYIFIMTWACQFKYTNWMCVYLLSFFALQLRRKFSLIHSYKNVFNEQQRKIFLALFWLTPFKFCFLHQNSFFFLNCPPMQTNCWNTLKNEVHLDCKYCKNSRRRGRKWRNSCLGNDKQWLWSTGNADGFEMTQSFRENRKFYFRSFQSAELIFVVKTPDEYFDVVKGIAFPSKTVESGSTRHRRSILETI